MINRGGEKVIPRRVDEALLQHPAGSAAPERAGAELATAQVD